MRMYMVSVAVSCDQNLVTIPRLFRKFKSDFVRLFGCKLFRRLEGLRVMVKEYAVIFAVNLFCRHEFLEGIGSVAVDSAD